MQECIDSVPGINFNYEQIKFNVEVQEKIEKDIIKKIKDNLAKIIIPIAFSDAYIKNYLSKKKSNQYEPEEKILFDC